MVRAPVLCLTIVAAFQLQLSAAQTPAVLPSPNEEVAVPAPTLTLARTLGLDPERDRARFLSELTRLVYTPPAGRHPEIDDQLRAAARPQPPARTGRPALTVPVPLTAELWSRAVFHRPVPADALVAAIAADRKAALLAYGLSALDDETLDYLSRDPLLLQELYEDAAPTFAAFGGSLRVHGNRIVPVGGAQAGDLWATVLGQPVDSPALFIHALFVEHDGRLAYLYDTIAALDEPRARFVLGLWIKSEASRRLRFEALANALLDAYPEWRHDALPFSRPLNDLGMLMLRMRVSPDGAPAPPFGRELWAAALDGGEQGDEPTSRDTMALESIDAAWLAETVTGGDMFWRGDRLDQFAFGQRLFERTPPEAWSTVVEAIRAFRSQRMLMLTLERMGIAAPAVYAAATRTGGRIADLGGSRAFWTLAQMQGALAVLARLRSAGSIDLASTEALTMSLVALPLDQGQYQGAVATWLVRQVWPRLPRWEPAASEAPLSAWMKDAELGAALAGPPPADGGTKLPWEGQDYRIDLSLAERRRLRAVRERQRSYPIDLALSLSDALDRLRSQRTPDDIATTERALEHVASDFAAELPRPSPDVMAPGVVAPRAAGDVIAELLSDLARARRSRDAGRAARVATPLAALVDAVLGEALLSFAYALELGDPGGTALLTRNVALRHDFGLGRRDRPFRTRLVWAMPRQDFLPGIPWHVAGSAVGLEVALSPLGLRRIGIERQGAVPSLPSNERHAIATGVALMNPARLRDADRTLLVEAIARGQRRATALLDRREAADEVANLLHLDGRRRRELSWTLSHGSADDVERMFSLGEFLLLGGGAPGVDLDAWGASGLQIFGCVCTRWIQPSWWRLLAGRPQLGMMAGVFPDLNVYVASVMGELGVPATLMRSVLASGALEFSEGVWISDPGDWTSLVAAARRVPVERIEDYVAAAAVVDGPLVPIDRSPATPEEGPR